jgi:hypothetical protein
MFKVQSAMQTLVSFAQKFLSRLVGVAAVALLFSGIASAQNAVLAGTKTIWLTNAQGDKVQWGTVVFDPPVGEKQKFAVNPSPDLREHFLAMRPFKCLAGPRQQLCWFPYTQVAQEIVGNDFTPLEYALMFLHTKPAALHVNSGNGLYYRLARSECGLVGHLHDVDMDPIVVPRNDRERPIKPAMLSVGESSSHWLPILLIE